MFFIHTKEKRRATLTARFLNVPRQKLNSFHKINTFHLYNIFFIIKN